MIKIRSQKYLKIIAGIALFLVIMGAIFNVNTYLMSAAIGIFVGSIVQFLFTEKELLKFIFSYTPLTIYSEISETVTLIDQLEFCES